jgi:hypothetical protein
VWQSAVPARLQNHVVCLPCFDDFAKARGIEYASTLRALYFAGRQATFIFESVCSVTTPETAD